jgi:hypothetical protein
MTISSKFIQLELSPHLYEWLRREVQKRGVEISDVVTEILTEYVQEQGTQFDITQTRTWALCGTLEIAEPDTEYIVGHDEEGRIITNYAENVDDMLYSNNS